MTNEEICCNTDKACQIKRYFKIQIRDVKSRDILYVHNTDKACQIKRYVVIQIRHVKSRDIL